jgi:hypothetical protein
MMEINDHTVPENMADSEAPSKPHAVTTIASVEIDPKAERALVWKFDLRLLPVLAIMYLFNSLDKSNLGNAKTAGLEGKPLTPPYIMIVSHTSLPKIPST